MPRGRRKKKEEEANSVKTDLAKKFVNTARGNYIISQALYVAAREMKKVPVPHRETSNIMDMEFLLDNLFQMYPQIHAVRESLRG